jgi:hypothetical protein
MNSTSEYIHYTHMHAYDTYYTPYHTWFILNSSCIYMSYSALDLCWTWEMSFVEVEKYERRIWFIIREDSVRLLSLSLSLFSVYPFYMMKQKKTRVSLPLLLSTSTTNDEHYLLPEQRDNYTLVDAGLSLSASYNVYICHSHGLSLSFTFGISSPFFHAHGELRFTFTLLWTFLSLCYVLFQRQSVLSAFTNLPTFTLPWYCSK